MGKKTDEKLTRYERRPVDDICMDLGWTGLIPFFFDQNLD